MPKPWSEGDIENTNGYYEPSGEVCVWCDGPAVVGSEFCCECRAAGAIEFRKTGSAKVDKRQELIDLRAEADYIMDRAQTLAEFLDDGTGEAEVRIAGNRALAIYGVKTGQLEKRADGGAWLACPSKGYAEGIAEVLNEHGVAAKVITGEEASMITTTKRANLRTARRYVDHARRIRHGYTAIPEAKRREAIAGLLEGAAWLRRRATGLERLPWEATS